MIANPPKRLAGDERHIRRGGTKLCNIQVKMQGMGGDNLSYSYQYLYEHN